MQPVLVALGTVAGGLLVGTALAALNALGPLACIAVLVLVAVVAAASEAWAHPAEVAERSHHGLPAK